MSGGGPASKSGAAKLTPAAASAPSKSPEVTSPVAVLIDYSPFVCQAGRVCQGCRDYHEAKRKAEPGAAADATAKKKARSGAESGCRESLQSESSAEEDGRRTIQRTTV
ncbi:hypothetical protein PVAP13_1KG255070 [Panicum virgatum]|uniref:Uncharacterized protein n=1 Tax=Panicum virgatum TaxID=38727 RepID=A0A8T0XMY6_PANVG|nr:hypothetical protein PVAP13_1KG255070 [Panicum virgatum]